MEITVIFENSEIKITREDNWVYVENYNGSTTSMHIDTWNQIKAMAN